MILKLVVAFLIGIIIYFLKRREEKSKQRVRLLRAIEERKLERSENFEKIKAYSSSLSQEQEEFIGKLSFDELREQLQANNVTCEQVLMTYQRKTLKCQEKTNCVCLFIEEAQSIAFSLDARAKSSNYMKPPLFGVPISIKECIEIKDMDNTCGYAHKLNKPSRIHATLVRQLIDLGAVPFVHTNVPQSLVSYGCSNPVYGSTSLPQDLSRVPGGSSGGEAALIANGGSLFGIGSDIGGSIRIPSTYCGIAGFKPSVDRFSHMGSHGTVPGRQLVQPNQGPMAPTIHTCIEYLKLAWKNNYLASIDPFVPPVLWQDHMYSSKEPITIGYYTFDGYIRAVPAYERAVLETKTLLESLGHRLVPFEVPHPQKMFELFVAAVSMDGGSYLCQQMDKDILSPESEVGFALMRLPFILQSIISRVLPNKKIARLLQCLPRNCSELREIYSDLEDYKHDFIVHMQKQGVKAILCPAMAVMPPHHGIPNKLIGATSYTALYNVLDFGAGVVPVTKVTKKDEDDLRNYTVKDEWDQLTRDESKDCLNFPIGVQIAAPPYHEEMALRLLREIEDSHSRSLESRS